MNAHIFSEIKHTLFYILLNFFNMRFNRKAGTFSHLLLHPICCNIHIMEPLENTMYSWGKKVRQIKSSYHHENSLTLLISWQFQTASRESSDKLWKPLIWDIHAQNATEYMVLKFSKSMNLKYNFRIHHTCGKKSWE